MSRRIPILLGATLLAASAARAQTAVPSGQFITPMAAPGAVFQALNPGLPDHPEYRATGALKTAVSPDGATLLVLTSGYNNLSYSAPGASFGSFEPSASNEYVFVYDIAGHNAGHPALAQVIQIPDAFEGLAFAPDGSTFYVSGGVDDVIYAFGLSGSSWARTATIPLGHQVIEGTPDNGGIGFHQSPSAAGIVLSADGKMLVVANIYNESISIVDTATNAVAREYDLRPYNTTPGIGDGAAGGETPFTVALATVGGVQAAYVSSIRDRELVVLNIAGALRGTKPTLITRIPMSGNPNNMAFDNPAHPTRLYVAQDNSDHVAVINLADNTIVEQIDVRAPPGILPTPRRYTGATPNSLAVSPNGKWLYVTDGGQNAVSVVSLDGPLPHHSVGLIPTGWYPQSVSLSSTGDELYIVNAKSDPGPNVAAASSATIALRGTGNPHANQTAQKQAYASNEYVLKIEPAGLLAVPVPNAAMLEALTRRVAANNRYDTPESADAVATMRALAGKIRHIIYIVKENRTFDQVLGDLTNGANVDPALTVFGARVTPNFHAMAQNFVTLDNFLDPAEVSGNGWEWSTAARETDLNAKQIPLDYAQSPLPSRLNQGGRGAPYNAEGQNNNVDVGVPTLAGRERAQPKYAAVTNLFPGGTTNFLPGTNNDAAPDGPDGDAQTGYLWDSALRAGLTVRNYGFFIDLGAGYANVPDPYVRGDIEAFVTNPTLLNRTDPYFRSFDNVYPDIWRFGEWQREFNQFVVNGDLPQLSLVRFMHDHMGDFATAIGGLDYPEAQQADDDLAVGSLVEAIARSPYRDDTLVFVVEDDSQDGPDHVDAHRSTAYIVGPYVKQKAVIRTRYTTVNMLRTIEDILGIDHLNLNDANAAPMHDVFDLTQRSWTFHAEASPFLRGTVGAAEAGIRYSDNLPAVPAHDKSWWAAKTAGFDWSREDRVPADRFNRILWEGLKGGMWTR